MDLEALIEMYFLLGLPYEQIKNALFVKHNHQISLRHLKRKLETLGLSRRKDYTDLDTVLLFIEDQLMSSGRRHGYRWMYLKCLRNGVKVKMEDIRHLMKILDPEGVSLRQKHCLIRRNYFSPGPNYCWHLDSYDKLKQFGLCINGCIDGFSRKIVWLRVWRSNNDPKVVANYYLDAIEEHGGCPTFMRADMGTENVRIAAMHRFIRRSQGNEPFLYGKSTLNTRIESWWCILRKQCCQTWIEDLHTMKNGGLFSGDTVDTNILQFCFMALLQEELDEVVDVWNLHRIRPNRNGSPHGSPLALYLLPDVEDKDDYLCPVPLEELDVCRTECTLDQNFPCEEEIFHLCCLHMLENNWRPPKHFNQARDLYLRLRLWLKTQL